MLDGASESGSDSTSRRQMLRGLGIATAAAMAGCTGDGGGGDGDGGGGGGNGESSGTGSADVGEAGERVPTLEIEYWSDMGSYTQVFEASIPGIEKDLEENLGLEVEAIPVAFTTQINNNFQDKRTNHFSYWTHSLSPDRLDPYEFCWRYNLTWAGANGSGNPSNYADCDHSVAALEQATATTPEQREQAVVESQSAMSEDIGTIPLAQILRFGAYDTENVEAAGLGSTGLQPTGYRALIESSSTSDQPLKANINPVTAETKTHLVINSSGSLALWNHLIYSTLMEYNEDYELEPVLAASEPEVANDGRDITFELRDATFHDGEPITAEDVKWTYNFIADNASNYPKASSPPYDSIEVVDEKTVTFRMQEPFLPLISRVLPRWGVLPKHIWEEGGASDNPRNVELDPIVGSGPYKVDNFQQGTTIQTTPHDGHPVHEPENDLYMSVYQDSQSAFRGFRNREINMFLRAPATIGNQIREDLDFAEVVNTNGFLPYLLYPQYSFGPGKFREMRHAVSQAIDRRALNQTALYGDSETLLHSTPFTPTHPSYPGKENLTKIADSETANPETAKQILRDEGWSFDDNGRLRYPEDVDLEPRWSQGDEPVDYPDQFPCADQLTSD